MIQLTLSEKDFNLLVFSLGKQPAETVFHLLTDIQAQVKAQKEKTKE